MSRKTCNLEPEQTYPDLSQQQKAGEKWGLRHFIASAYVFIKKGGGKIRPPANVQFSQTTAVR